MDPILKYILERDVMYKIGFDEGFEIGFKEGFEEEIIRIIKKLLTGGRHSVSEIAGIANVTEAFVNSVRDV